MEIGSEKLSDEITKRDRHQLLPRESCAIAGTYMSSSGEIKMSLSEMTCTMKRQFGSGGRLGKARGIHFRASDASGALVRGRFSLRALAC